MLRYKNTTTTLTSYLIMKLVKNNLSWLYIIDPYRFYVSFTDFLNKVLNRIQSKAMIICALLAHVIQNKPKVWQ